MIEAFAFPFEARKSCVQERVLAVACIDIGAGSLKRAEEVK